MSCEIFDKSSVAFLIRLGIFDGSPIQTMISLFVNEFTTQVHDTSHLTLRALAQQGIST